MIVLALSMMSAAPATAQDPRAATWQLAGMMAIMGFMFYFAIWRPQQKKAKEQEALMKSLKRGDKVITSSGICGVIVGLKERTVVVRSEDTKMELLRSTVVEVVERAETSSPSGS